MRLRAQEERVRRQFDHFDKVRRHVAAREDHAVTFEDLRILVVEFEPVAVSLADVEDTVGLGRKRSRYQSARIGAEPHRPAHHLEVSLILHEVDDRMRRLGLDFARVSEFQAAQLWRTATRASCIP